MKFKQFWKSVGSERKTNEIDMALRHHKVSTDSCLNPLFWDNMKSEHQIGLCCIGYVSIFNTTSTSLTKLDVSLLADLT